MSMALHQEILDSQRKEVFTKLAAFKSDGFLAGGTALALQLGHRVSYDFDVFCAKPIGHALLKKARNNFAVKKVLVNNSDEFSFLTAGEIKISFIYYPFNLDKFLIKSAGRISLLSEEGVAVAKAYTINRRNSWRDYVDLYFLVEERGLGLKKIIIEAKKVYEEMFSEKLFLAQLIYTDDIAKSEIKEIKILSGQIFLPAVKKFFQKRVDEYLKK